MKRGILQTTLFTLCLACASAPSSANPISFIAGLIHHHRHTDKSETQAPLPLEEQLTDLQNSVMVKMGKTRWLSGCVKAAENNNPIAAYQTRKIAEFGAFVTREITATGRMPNIASLNYQPAAEAFRWCKQHTAAGRDRAPKTLKNYAHTLATLVAQASLPSPE